jgi:hypothetical protein
VRVKIRVRVVKSHLGLMLVDNTLLGCCWAQQTNFHALVPLACDGCHRRLVKLELKEAARLGETFQVRHDRKEADWLQLGVFRVDWVCPGIYFSLCGRKASDATLGILSSVLALRVGNIESLGDELLDVLRIIN